MKNLIYLFLAAILGSALTIAGTEYLLEDEQPRKKYKFEQFEETPAYGAMYTEDEGGEAVPLDFTSVAEKTLPAVVHIRSTMNTKGQSPQARRFEDFFENSPFEDFFGNPRSRSPRQRQGKGSGVIINENGYVVTNNHVVGEAEDIQVRLSDNREFKAEVVGSDPSTDIALLKIDAENLPSLSFVNSDNVKVGEWVMAVGNPFNLNSTATVGIVSAKARNINILKKDYAIESFIQTDAAINPGNSGGALVDLKGNIIGINTAIASPTGTYAGYGFAVPSNIVNKVIEDLMEYGVVQRGYIGVRIRDVNSELAEEKSIEVTEGVYIQDLMENGAAQEAGLQPGDVIVSVNDQPVKSSPELQGIIALKRPGDVVNVKVLRDGSTQNFELELKNREGSDEIVSRDKSKVTTSLGADLTTLSEEEARNLNIEGGVRVTNIQSGSIQRYTRIKEGFIITKVDDEPVHSVEEFKNKLENKDNGGVLLEGVYENYPGVHHYGLGLNN